MKSIAIGLEQITGVINLIIVMSVRVYSSIAKYVKNKIFYAETIYIVK